MIYTITFNPAIDYVVRMGSKLLPGMTNRSDSEECYFGGKGINVSTILKNLGIDNTALGFVAGFTGKAIAESVDKKGIKADFIQLPEGISRINVKIKGEAETEINAQGPKIPKEALDKLFNFVARFFLTQTEPEYCNKAKCKNIKSAKICKICRNKRNCTKSKNHHKQDYKRNPRNYLSFFNIKLLLSKLWKKEIKEYTANYKACLNYKED